MQTLLAVLLTAGLVGTGTAATMAMTGTPMTPAGGMHGGGDMAGMHGNGPMQGGGPMADHGNHTMDQGMGGCPCCQMHETRG